MDLNVFIQSKLSELDLERVSVVTANQWTNEAGILNDDDNRPGRPLRVKCRNNQIHGAVKENGRWFIYRVGSHVEKPNPTALKTEIPDHVTIDYIEDISHYEDYFNGIFDRSLLYHLHYNDPVTILVKTRIAGEHISRLLASKKCDAIYNDDMKLHEVVSNLSDSGHISDLAKNIMHSIRVYGNIAVHNPADIRGHEEKIARIVCGSIKLYMDLLNEKGLLDELA